MVRLIIIAIGVFLIWVLFFSKFEKQRKLQIALAAIVISIAAIWFESSMGTPKQDVVTSSEVIDCGSSAKQSYRSNFDLNLCLQNQSSIGDIKRLGFDVVAVQCSQAEPSAQECVEVQIVQREVAVSIPALGSFELQQNLSFDRVDPSLEGLQWQVRVSKVYAVKSATK